MRSGEVLAVSGEDVYSLFRDIRANVLQCLVSRFRGSYFFKSTFETISDGDGAHLLWQ